MKNNLNKIPYINNGSYFCITSCSTHISAQCIQPQSFVRSFRFVSFFPIFFLFCRKIFIYFFHRPLAPKLFACIHVCLPKFFIFLDLCLGESKGAVVWVSERDETVMTTRIYVEILLLFCPCTIHIYTRLQLFRSFSSFQLQS